VGCEIVEERGGRELWGEVEEEEWGREWGV